MPNMPRTLPGTPPGTPPTINPTIPPTIPPTTPPTTPPADNVHDWIFEPPIGSDQWHDINLGNDFPFYYYDDNGNRIPRFFGASEPVVPSGDFGFEDNRAGSGLPVMPIGQMPGPNFFNAPPITPSPPVTPPRAFTPVSNLFNPFDPAATVREGEFTFTQPPVYGTPYVPPINNVFVPDRNPNR